MRTLHGWNHQLGRLLVGFIWTLESRLELLKVLAFRDKHWAVDCIDKLHDLSSSS